MNWDQLNGNWELQRLRVAEHGDKLTNEDLDAVAGSRENLFSLLQKRFRMEASAAEVSLKLFLEILEKEQALDALLKATEAITKQSPGRRTNRHESGAADSVEERATPSDKAGPNH